MGEWGQLAESGKWKFIKPRGLVGLIWLNWKRNKLLSLWPEILMQVRARYPCGWEALPPWMLAVQRDKIVLGGKRFIYLNAGEKRLRIPRFSKVTAPRGNSGSWSACLQVLARTNSKLSWKLVGFPRADTLTGAGVLLGMRPWAVRSNARVCLSLLSWGGGQHHLSQVATVFLGQGWGPGDGSEETD